MRAGKLEHPAGLYSEIAEVGTLRPFLTLPQSLYGRDEFVADSFAGLGLTGRQSISDDWAITYDLYAGDMHIDSLEPLSFLEKGGRETAQRETIHGVVGGRVSWLTGDFRFGLSAFTGDDSSPGTRHDTWAGHFQYLTDRIWLRSEAGRQKEGEASFRASYLEAAYFLSPHWQLASRFERLGSETGGDRAFARLLAHRDRAVGVNYWFSRDLVLKASVHEVTGNRYARPEDLQDLWQALEQGTLRRKTRLVALGVQFSF